MVDPVFSDGLSTVYNGEALAILRSLPRECASICITDPPYSSGGMVRGDRMARVASKYQQTQTLTIYDDFSGDNRDQRGFLTWCCLWMEEVRRVLRPGSIFGCFTDWRQLPTVTDALQAGGFIWRGIVPWEKPGCRPIQGRYRCSCEYLVWGTNGSRPLDGPCVEGIFKCPVVGSKKRHMTEKPVRLMEAVLGVCFEDDPCVLDPFMGSGTTLKAARNLGIKGIGIEISDSICATACDRLIEEDSPLLI